MIAKQNNTYYWHYPTISTGRAAMFAPYYLALAYCDLNLVIRRLHKNGPPPTRVIVKRSRKYVKPTGENGSTEEATRIVGKLFKGCSPGGRRIFGFFDARGIGRAREERTMREILNIFSQEEWSADYKEVWSGKISSEVGHNWDGKIGN